MENIALIGSTGSIGQQVLSVVRKYPDRFKIKAICAGKSSAMYIAQRKEFAPERCVIVERDGEDAAEALCVIPDVDMVVVACSGFIGLRYSLAALNAGKTVALANKETLVCGGDLLRDFVKSGKIIPVDSEISAIWQCVGFKKTTGSNKIILTASGGPFIGREWDSLAYVTPEEALRHPTWKMGEKITVDSATLLNKGYEAMELHHLFGTPYDKIETVLHPQSVVHSMVEFPDGSVIAQMAKPDMEIPILLALSRSARVKAPDKSMDFSEPISLDFKPLKDGMYPCFDLALDCAKAGGVLPTALNAASEVAVNAFLNGKIKYTDIFAVEEFAVGMFRRALKEVSYGYLQDVDIKANFAAWQYTQKLSK